MTSPFTVMAGSLHRSEGMVFLSKLTCGNPGLGPLRHLGQVRGLPCQHGDGLIQVALGGGPGDAVVTGRLRACGGPRRGAENAGTAAQCRGPTPITAAETATVMAIAQPAASGGGRPSV